MKIRRLAISAAFAAVLAALPPASATAQQPYPPLPPPPPPYYPYPACSPFPLEWPFCVAGAIVGLAAAIVAAPFRAIAGPPYWAYYRPPPYYPPRPPYPPANWGYSTTPGTAAPGYSGPR